MKNNTKEHFFSHYKRIFKKPAYTNPPLPPRYHGDSLFLYNQCLLPDLHHHPVNSIISLTGNTILPTHGCITGPHWSPLSPRSSRHKVGCSSQDMNLPTLEQCWTFNYKTGWGKVRDGDGGEKAQARKDSGLYKVLRASNEMPLYRRPDSFSVICSSGSGASPWRQPGNRYRRRNKAEATHFPLLNPGWGS